MIQRAVGVVVAHGFVPNATLQVCGAVQPACRSNVAYATKASIQSYFVSFCQDRANTLVYACGRPFQAVCGVSGVVPLCIQGDMSGSTTSTCPHALPPCPCYPGNSTGKGVWGVGAEGPPAGTGWMGEGAAPTVRPQPSVGANAAHADTTEVAAWGPSPCGGPRTRAPLAQGWREVGQQVRPPPPYPPT